jgi:tRNA pseudouridine synthase 10
VKFGLCSFCKNRFKKSPLIYEDENCFICQNIISNIPSLIAAALEKASKYEWESFFISSSFPKKIFVAEEEVATFFKPGEFLSIKNAVNAFIIKQISVLSKKKNDQRKFDLLFKFDFERNNVDCLSSSIYLAGNYLKFSREFCQSRWICNNCKGKGCPRCNQSGQNYPSVEQEIGKVVLPFFEGEDFILHANGREDVDVRTLGTGRPFALEIVSPKKRIVNTSDIERKINESKVVNVIELKFVGRNFVDAICNSHFRKKYKAVVQTERKLTNKDLEIIKSYSGTIINQKTPTRVKHRRADLLRKRKIYELSAQLISENTFSLEILADAGTYIKEFISSDGGRTYPSIADILNTKATCLNLDVICIKDYFLKTISTV